MGQATITRRDLYLFPALPGWFLHGQLLRRQHMTAHGVVRGIDAFFGADTTPLLIDAFQQAFSPPKTLHINAVVTQNFCSGEPSLDMCLRSKALKNEGKGSRTYVVCQGDRVVGFYSLAVGSVAHEFSPGNIKRNMPDPVPVMILGRLAVDQSAQGKCIGKALVRDALLRTIQAASIAGIRAILVHALHDRAATFYQECGFRASPVSPLAFMLRLEDIQ